MLGERLRDLRRRSFVGREREVRLFRSALADFGLVFVHGPGGVGKSALLDMFADIAADAGRSAVRVDARHLRLGPDVLPALADGEVLFIDTYELLEPLDDWVRERYLPSLPGDALVVIAGRRAPSPRWYADPAWRHLMREIALGNLPPADGQAYLAAQGVPEKLHDRLLAISHGHPLLLSMLVDAVGKGAEPYRLGDVPSVVGALLAQIVDEAPSPLHRAALELCAHAPVTTADLLRAVLGDEAEKLFAWLRTLPFIDDGPNGLYPHDVARDALDADLRWRDGARYAEMRRRLSVALRARILATADEREQIQLLADVIAVEGSRSKVATCSNPPATMQAYADTLQDGDRAPIIAMTTAWQGEEQAELAAYWLDRRPGAFRVFRTVSGEPRGYAACLELTETDLGVDPGVNAMWRYAHEHGAPRTGERVRAWRFFLDRDHGQLASPSVTLFAACQTLDALTHHNTAWTLVGAYADPALWAPTMHNLGFEPAKGAEYTIGSTRFPVFAHDWRRTDVDEWLEILHARQAGALATAADGTDNTVLSEPQFAEAVQAALRDLRTPNLLQENPLLRSRAVRQNQRDGNAPAETLRELLETAVSVLPPNLRVLADRTFLHPVTTQERIAESLHLSFNTYRRHRDRAVTSITEWLWAAETGHRTSRP
ncbi:ATP-binding protein [Streptomyces yatensis]|nr:ATP-binding protein [Streptomyces yatensis]